MNPPFTPASGDANDAGSVFHGSIAAEPSGANKPV
jgi:hypothetical protein